MKPVILISLFLILLYPLKSRGQSDTISGKKAKLRTNVRLETTLSYIFNFDGTKTYEHLKPDLLSSGVGISFMPEFKKIKKHFSFLAGMNVSYSLTRSFDYAFYENFIYGTLDNGYQIHCQVPIWFRWTYGKKVSVFFQFGWGIGGDQYEGWGNQTIYQGHYYGELTSYGWKKYATGFMNILPVGVGIRKTIIRGIEIVSFLEVSPLNFQFNQEHTIQQCAQFHVGFNFSTQRHSKNNK